jgi:hypoxanthine phosphoribosyltransferase
LARRRVFAILRRASGCAYHVAQELTMAFLNSLEVLIARDRIAQRVAELGELITHDYQGKQPILLCVLKGSFVFVADLARAIDLPVRVEFLGVRSYGDATTSTGEVEVTHDLTRPIQGEDVLIVEDIVDTGTTSAFLRQQLATRHPNSLKLCGLLHKPSRALMQVTIDYTGFTIDDHFVVGYGLDAAQQYRNLPDICILPPG